MFQDCRRMEDRPSLKRFIQLWLPLYNHWWSCQCIIAREYTIQEYTNILTHTHTHTAKRWSVTVTSESTVPVTAVRQLQWSAEVVVGFWTVWCHQQPLWKNWTTEEKGTKKRTTLPTTLSTCLPVDQSLRLFFFRSEWFQKCDGLHKLLALKKKV